MIPWIHDSMDACKTALIGRRSFSTAQAMDYDRRPFAAIAHAPMESFNLGNHRFRDFIARLNRRGGSFTTTALPAVFE